MPKWRNKLFLAVDEQWQTVLMTTLKQCLICIRKTGFAFQRLHLHKTLTYLGTSTFIHLRKSREFLGISWDRLLFQSSVGEHSLSQGQGTLSSAASRASQGWLTQAGSKRHHGSQSCSVTRTAGHSPRRHRAGAAHWAHLALHGRWHGENVWTRGTSSQKVCSAVVGGFWRCHQQGVRGWNAGKLVRSGIRKYSSPQGVFTLLRGRAISVQGEVSQADGAPKGFAAAVQGTVDVSLSWDPPV